MGGAEEEVATTLPENLRCGLNLPFLFGGSGYYLAKGKNPYNATRLNELLPTAQWTKIRTPFTLTQGVHFDNHFDHVRIPIDPRCFLADATGAFPTSGADLTVCTDNMKALMTQVERANAAGLAVIIDFHPTHFNAAHYDLERNAWRDAEPSVQWQYSYDGPMKLDMVTKGNYVNGTRAGHPLVKFWHEFLTKFKWVYSVELLKSPDWSKVYLEIMNEPFIDLDPEYIQHDMPILQWRNLLTSKCGEWREVQSWAIREIQSIDSNAKVIATTALSDPRDLAGWKPVKWASLDPSYPAFGNVYSTTGDSVDHPEKVIYNMVVGQFEISPTSSSIVQT